MKINTAITIILLSLITLGCGDRVTVNTGEVGKQINTSGLEEEIWEPGAYRLDACFASACPKLIRLQTARAASEITVASVFLPKSNVDLSDVKFGIQFHIKSDKGSINKAFEEIRSAPAAESDQQSARERLISSEMIFETYVQRKAPEAVISALREFTVEQVLSEVDKIAKAAKDTVNVALKDTPVEVTEFGFPNGIGTPPKEVLEAKRKLYAIDEEKAREIKALEAALEIEKQRQVVQTKRVENDVKNAKTAGVPYQIYVGLKNQERFADAAETGTPIGLVPNSIE